MNDAEWAKAGIMVRTIPGSNMVEADPHALVAAARDVMRLEWLVKSAARINVRGCKKHPQWSLLYWDDIWAVEPDATETEWYSNWRDAIDEAMRGDDEHN